VPPFHVRAEFRRHDRAAPWVLAGVVVDGGFHPVRPGVERLRMRLPEPGLVGWSDLPTAIVAADPATAAAAALDVARAAWPGRVRDLVPFASGVAESVG